ncbi:Tonsoku-like protein, partial [Stegodyphus mimosarum]
MAQAGQAVKETEEFNQVSLTTLETKVPFIDDAVTPFSQTDRRVEKRARSPSISSDSSEDEMEHPEPLFSIRKEDWDNANQVQSEYQAVMASLRRSAKTATKPMNSAPEPAKTSLLNETEIVNDWLIKDTDQIPKVKRKKRKMSRLNVRTSKSICNYLTSNDKSANNNNTSLFSNDDEENFITEDDSSNSSYSFQVTSAENEKIVSQPPKRDNSKVSFCLRVRITDKLILVPVPEENCTIGWLAEQAANRYQNLVGSRPHLTLMTKDGALLSSSDLLRSIFDNNDEVTSSVEFWDQPTLQERYVQMCNKRGVKALPSIEKRFQNFETCPELNFSNCSITSLQITLIFLSLSNYKTLQHLNLSGTVLTDP